LRSSIALDMRRLAIALSGALLVAGVFAGPVGGGSTTDNTPNEPVRLCQKF
jgi:hypothetical protein